MLEPTPVTKQEALEALRAAAWTEEEEAYYEPSGFVNNTTGEPFYSKIVTKPERRMVHTMSGFGMDLPLEACEQHIEEADEVYWQVSIFSHDLHARTGNDFIAFDVPSPTREKDLLEMRRDELQKRLAELEAGS